MVKNKNEQIAEIYKTHRRKMLSLCMKYTRNKEEAEDFLHEGILKAIEKSEMIDLTKNPVSYIMRIVVNNMLDKHRSAGKYEMIGMDYISNSDRLGAETPGDPEDDERERTACVKHANRLLNGISERDRTIFKMHVIDGKKHYEIADLLNVNYNTVRCTYVRVRNRLNDSIKKIETV